MRCDIEAQLLPTGLEHPTPLPADALDSARRDMLDPLAASRRIEDVEFERRAAAVER
jgi:hypothetical protein